ncbi:unnamed protein product, partial [Prorocentrum cordatum]
AERERARCAAHAQSRARRARFGSLPREARQASGSVPKKCPMKAKLAEQNTRSQRGEQEEQRPGGGGGGGGGRREKGWASTAQVRFRKSGGTK